MSIDDRRGPRWRIIMRAGDDYGLSLLPVDGSGNPVIVSSATATVWRNRTLVTTLGTAVDPLTGEITVTFTDTASAALGPGQYRWELKVVYQSAVQQWLTDDLILVSPGSPRQTPALQSATLSVGENVSATLEVLTVGAQGPAGPAGPAGPPGPQGVPGVPGAAATVAVGTTSTLAPGSSATVANSGTSSAAVFDFGIPEGQQGAPGTPGAAATVAVGTTSTLSPGSPATVTNSGTSSAAVFDFGIPEGLQGATGPTGPTGPPGVVAASAPITYDSGTQTVGIDPTGYVASVNGQAGAASLAFDDLTDVDAPTPGTDDLVTFDGNDYVTTDAPTVDLVAFDVAAAETVGVGEVAWNDTDGTLDVGMKGGNVRQQVGMEQFIRAKHDTNGGITRGTVYYLTGATGGVKTVLPAQADAAATCKTTIGVGAETITGGGQALITTFGLLRGLPDALFTNVTEGTVVYLSAATPGAFTSTPPTPPDHRVIVGFCVRKQSNNNELFVSVKTGLDLNELCDVEAPSPTAGQVIAWDTVDARWESKSLTSSDVSATPLRLTLNDRIASYVLAASDEQRLVRMNVASGNTLTVPPASSVTWAVGTQIHVTQQGAGQTTLTPGLGVTINGTPGLKLRAQHSTATLIYVGSDVWLAVGDLAA